MTIRTALLIVLFGVTSVAAEDPTYTESNTDPYYTAIVNISYIDPQTKEMKMEHKEMGTYGPNANTETVTGVLVHVINEDNTTDKAGCKEYWFKVPIVPWIALVQRGTCYFDKKIRMATKKNNASGVIIYNDKPKEPVIMQHQGECCNGMEKEIFRIQKVLNFFVSLWEDV